MPPFPSLLPLRRMIPARSRPRWGIACLLLAAASASSAAAPPADPHAQRIEEIIKGLSLEEKVAQLNGLGSGSGEFGDADARAFGTRGVPRVGLPDLIMGHAITGVRCGRDQSVHATYFCTPSAIGATWDPELYRQVSTAMAREMRELGQNLSLGTTLNIVRNPLGGRNWECFSEDPFLIGRMAVPYVQAMQANGIIAGPKHFVANEQENQRFDINNVVDERTLREIYLPPFEAAVVEGGALNIMGSYNRLNGTFMCENSRLLTEVLRKEWGFQGFVLSDFGKATHSTLGSVQAGLNVEMPSPLFYGDKLLAAVRAGKVSEARIDELLREKLHAMAAVGMFDPGYPSPKGEVHSDAHQRIALEVARRAPVLLKNENHTLPLDGKVRRLAVIGPNAERFADLAAKSPDYAYYLQGGGSGRVYYFHDAVVSPLEGLRRHSPQGVEIGFALGAPAPSGKNWRKRVASADREKLRAEAVALARRSDAAVVVVGLSGFVESEGRDRDDAALPAGQDELIAAVAAANPRTTVIVIAGSFVGMSKWIDRVPAALFCFYDGERLGEGLADILWGRVSPGGKLPVTFPLNVAQYPAGSIYRGGPYGKTHRDNTYSEGIFVGYRHFDQAHQKVLFPFGHGLSYTRFAYEGLKVTSAPGASPVVAELTLRNTGQMTGDEVAQLYVAPPAGGVARPPRELKAFERVTLRPGESRTLRFELNRRSFAHYDPAAGSWVVSPGDYTLEAGSSSRDIRRTATTTLQGVSP